MRLCFRILSRSGLNYYFLDTQSEGEDRVIGFVRKCGFDRPELYKSIFLSSMILGLQAVEARTRSVCSQGPEATAEMRIVEDGLAILESQVVYLTDLFMARDLAQKYLSASAEAEKEN
jgi:hypothetical protein